jgi:hypothetical protein
MRFSETAAKVIDLATTIRDYWNTELPKRHPSYPIVAPGEDSGPSPPEEAELREFLEQLSDEEIYKLVLVMYLGRGDFGTDDLRTHYRTLKDRFRKRERAISQMEGKAPLAEYLSDGMANLKKNGIDIDELMSASVASPN